MNGEAVNSRRMAVERETIEELIDEMLADSFPASDPPRWESAATRIRQQNGDV